MNKDKHNSGQDAILVIPKGNDIKLSLKSASNLKLILEKYIPFYNLQNKRMLDISRAKEKVYELKPKNFQEADNYIKKLNERQRQIADKSFTLMTKSRLIVGLGGGSALEVSIKLHFIYGFPYIPSSAIKGVLRAYKILEKVNFDFEKYSKFEDKIESGDRKDKEIGAFVRVFGNQQYKGDLIILDAIPEKFPILEEDIMNPHYPKYYNDKEPPTDDQNPVPIKFLTVAKGEKFNFYFKNSQVYKEAFETDLKQDLIKAFNYLGIGAKTGIGYGVLDG
ncbi:type III-B CRISPR module RAMP protein Cmr6 [Sulfurihydrogenibium sp.]|jgi:CRISPR-associated protein Cmr6|uniref:type III-B CRISPR module RAMP protein Cmr6 n=1 Tax=Sulfurihydrogenibium sp. TaxID=2053621 RepID=UPI002635778F|nr:type III-B CRISPR module RAMP protein Cmr6 [Sulfurihydrogenibium sp.]